MQSMESGDAEQVVKVVSSALATISWRLRSSSRHRLEIDILALCTGLRPVIMIDYGGKMPELQENLCSLLQICRKESPFIQPLRVIVIGEMIYLAHKVGFLDLLSSVNFDTKLLFVDLEHDPPKMLTQTQPNSVISELVSVQKMIFSMISTNEANSSNVDLENKEPKDLHLVDASSEIIDLSSCMNDMQVTIPTLNGWLLEYPVVYLFGKDKITDAVYNLTMKSLHIFQIFVRRNEVHGGQSRKDELLSFSVPYDLSIEGENETWAKEFVGRMQSRFEKCSKVWKNLEMEVSYSYPQAIAF